MKYLSFEKSVGGVIYRRENNKILYLLVRYRSLQWDFPKGHVEQGESEEQTMRREVREETGIEDVDILPGFRMSARYYYLAKGNEKKERLSAGKGIRIFKRAVYFAGETKTEEVKIDFENKGYVWLDYESALKKLGNSGSKKILSAVEKVLSQRKIQ